AQRGLLNVQVRDTVARLSLGELGNAQRIPWIHMEDSPWTFLHPSETTEPYRQANGNQPPVPDRPHRARPPAPAPPPGGSRQPPGPGRPRPCVSPLDSGARGG